MTRQEQVTLVGLGVLALLGLSVLLWQRQRPPLSIEGGPAPVPAAQWDEALATARQIDINTAGAAELERLPQVGPMLASRIVAYRSEHGAFQRAEELLQVPGIGPKTYELLQAYVTVE